MHVAHVNLHYDPDLASGEALVERYATLSGWGEALVRAGVRVSVYQRFHRDADLTRDDVAYRFRKDPLPARLRPWQVPMGILRRVARDRPDLVHLHGFRFSLQAGFLRAIAPPTTGVVVQHHAEPPWRGLLGRLQGRLLRRVDGFLFASAEMGAAWQDRGVLSREALVGEVMEGSTHFRPEARQAARARTGLSGDPLLLWVGRLIPLKDPLTVLRGFASILADRPGARLHMIYSEADLLPRIEAELRRAPRLAHCVRLLGAVPHEQMADYYNSADLFVLGSHREGSGYALCEAMACGTEPVVTDIPSFRAMTGAGEVGALWKVGDPDAFARALRHVLVGSRRARSEATRRRFEEHLCFDAIARRAIVFYRKILNRRR